MRNTSRPTEDCLVVVQWPYSHTRRRCLRCPGHGSWAQGNANNAQHAENTPRTTSTRHTLTIAYALVMGIKHKAMPTMHSTQKTLPEPLALDTPWQLLMQGSTRDTNGWHSQNDCYAILCPDITGPYNRHTHAQCNYYARGIHTQCILIYSHWRGVHSA